MDFSRQHCTFTYVMCVCVCVCECVSTKFLIQNTYMILKDRISYRIFLLGGTNGKTCSSVRKHAHTQTLACVHLGGLGIF